jgi:thermitase
MPTNKLIVCFHPRTNAHTCHATHRKAGTVLRHRISALHADLVSTERDWQTCFDHYQACDHVRYVEPLRTYRKTYIPNDPYFLRPVRTSRSGLQHQWGLQQIRLPEAWEHCRKRPPRILVAVIDSGIDPFHPDLKGKFIEGISFDSAGVFDDCGHGTHLAGIIAAATDTAYPLGIAGITFNTVRVMPIKSLNRNGDGSNLAIAQGIVYAADAGARVINLSLGATEYSQLLQDATRYAWRRGCVIVSSAGNSGKEEIEYPSGNNFVLTVSATTPSDTLHHSSSYGRMVGVAAPGENILSTLPTYKCLMTEEEGYLERYDALTGTSMSTAFVSGLAGLLLAHNPRMRNFEVVQTIQRSAFPPGGDKAWEPLFGYGRIDAYAAITRQFPPAESGSLYGQVLDAADLPATDVEVRAAGATATTARDGMFRLPHLPPGSHSVFLNGRPADKVTIVPGCDTYLELRT